MHTTYSVHAGILKPWRGRLPWPLVVFSFYHVLPLPLSGLNWRSLFPPWGSGPPFPKMAPPFTGSAHTPLPGSGTLPVMSRLSCPSFPVPTVPSFLSFSVVLSSLPCPSLHVSAILPRLSCSGSCLSAFLSLLSYQSCLKLSCLSCPVPVSSRCPVTPCCHVLTLSKVSF